MKIRSKALHTYLQHTGVLNGTSEAIALAKKQYRALYKKHWRQNRHPRKELRFEITPSQYQTIKHAALQHGQTVIAYARNSILATANKTSFISQKDNLLQILQLLSMAVTGMQKHNRPLGQIAELLEQAEQLLLTYLIHTNNKNKYSENKKGNSDT